MLYVTGGRQRASAERQEEWHRFAGALILGCESDGGGVRSLVDYQSPPEVCPDNQPSVVFKAGSRCGDELHVCTQTEVLRYRLPDFRRLGHLSLPFFNDLHHVTPTPWGTLLVAVTGLDVVAELSRDGVLLRCWDVLGDEPWRRFSRDVDYRRVATTKPHLSHPNAVFTIAEDIWVTRFEQRDAICLTRPRLRIDIAIERPHDGCVFDGLVYFTTVDGHVVKADPQRGEVLAVWPLAALIGCTAPLGWCRGLKVVSEDQVVVGFSRLRWTRFSENVAWAKSRLRSALRVASHVRPQPTRIVALDLRRGEVLWQANLEDQGMHAVFSIL